MAALALALVDLFDIVADALEGEAWVGVERRPGHHFLVRRRAHHGHPRRRRIDALRGCGRHGQVDPA